MRRHGLVFDHNLHALRIVEDFELRYAAFRGLNLTFEVREGIIKHSRSYNAAEFPELSEYLLEKQPPLEAQLIDATDELAYSTADLDDGYEARLLILEQIKDEVPVFNRFFDEVEQLYPEAQAKLQFNETLRRILDRWVSDLIHNTQAQVEAIASVESCSPGRPRPGNDGLKAISLDDVRSHPQRLVGLGSEAEAERQQTKAFLHDNLYFSTALEPEKEDAERVISQLFDFWIKHREKLPSSYQEKAEGEPLARVICDYIAGMTDNYIFEQYEKHCG
jgi:dGTPase